MNSFSQMDKDIDLQATINRLRQNYKSGITRPLAYRQRQLAGLSKFLKECEKEILDALYEDLGKPAFEAFSGDIDICLAELAFVGKRLSAWMKPQRVSLPLKAQPAKGYIYKEPLGVVLIFTCWNMPFQLAIMPLIGAIAAGNCAILKPSELAQASSRLLAKRLPEYVDSSILQVIEGDCKVSSALLNEQFDHIFYTGNNKIARLVMEAAAKHLTPVTLELGGKNPCIIDQHINLKVAARRLVWGKFYNAGQTCLAPNYVLVHEAVEHDLLKEIKDAITDFYGEDPHASPDFARIANVQHHRRLMNLLPKESHLIYMGGQANEEERYLAPTVLRNIPLDSLTLQEEIFGPILPVIKIKNIKEAIQIVNSRPKPLTLYLFTDDKETAELVRDGTSSGSLVINHMLFQVAIPTLPFGGIGESGIGAYHGKKSFEVFTHHKTLLVKPLWFDPNLIYPPFNKFKLTVMRFLTSLSS